MTISLESGFRLVGPDGTVKFFGNAQLGVVLQVFNDEASAAINAGEAVKVDTADTKVQQPGTFIADPNDSARALKEVLKVLRVAAATDIALIGVALTDIPAQGVGHIAGSGSLIGVKSTGTTTVGNALTGSATAGSVGNDAAPLIGEALGECVKSSGTGGSDSGSATVSGVLVGPR